ncbi:cation diffusion facilitator family transporter [Corynebacterium sp.]|uniref:cation diffusion facilitator family transporter n=1 Tax=Corynebacterium sp. TaxID=1720 RepID=UPI003B3B8521
MRTEQQALRVSLVSVLILSCLGIGFGLVSGSSAIMFDGVFSLVDAVMSVVSIVLAGLIADSTARGLSRRFSMGFWHFEPLVLCLNAVVMMSVAGYALLQAVTAVLDGGREVEFGPAVVYTVVVLLLAGVTAVAEHCANRTIGSALVAMDVKGWVMSAGVTGALLIAFVIGMVIDGTSYAHLMPYVDPVVLIIVATVLIPVPLRTLVRALSEIALVTPPDLHAEGRAVADRVVAEEGFLGADVYAAQVGRSRQVEIAFRVSPDTPPRPLTEWHGIRQAVSAELGGDNPDNWIAVWFTTDSPEVREP